MHPLVASLDLEALMREALADGRIPTPPCPSALIVERVPYVADHIDTYLGGVLRDESRALCERYEPGLIPYLGDEVVRHRQRR